MQSRLEQLRLVREHRFTHGSQEDAVRIVREIQLSGNVTAAPRAQCESLRRTTVRLLRCSGSVCGGPIRTPRILAAQREQLRLCHAALLGIDHLPWARRRRHRFALGIDRDPAAAPDQDSHKETDRVRRDLLRIAADSACIGLVGGAIPVRGDAGQGGRVVHSDARRVHPLLPCVRYHHMECFTGPSVRPSVQQTCVHTIYIACLS